MGPGYLTKYSSIDVLASEIHTVSGGDKYFSAELLERFLGMTNPSVI